MINDELSSSSSAQLREKFNEIQHDIERIISEIEPIDFSSVEQKLQTSMDIDLKEENEIQREYRLLRKYLIHVERKLLLGYAYLHPRLVLTRKKRKKKKTMRTKILSIEEQWRKGIESVYRNLQKERDRSDLNRLSPMIEEDPFVAPLAPATAAGMESLIIPFETPPMVCPSPPENDRLQSIIDDTIVKPARLINRTLGNLTQMSFHIDPDHCSSPKGSKKTKVKKFALPPLPAPPAPPVFSSTAIFDSHAFFTQTTHKTKKQKKKIDISRQPLIMSMNEAEKKSSRRAKRSPYDFQDDDRISLSSSSNSKGTKKFLTDDVITARFAKNSHYQTHQSSMGTNQSKKSSKEKTKRSQGNILGIGHSSPLTISNDENRSPHHLSFDDDDDQDDRRHQSTRRIFSSSRRQRRK